MISTRNLWSLPCTIAASVWIPFSLSVLSHRSTLTFLRPIILHFSPVCVCVDCDGRETASTFLFMFRSMFSTSRIVFAVFSYRLCVSIFFNPKTQKKKKKMKKKNYRAVLVVLIFVILRILFFFFWRCMEMRWSHWRQRFIDLFLNLVVEEHKARIGR